MAYAYVYSPFTGNNWGQNNYCYCCGGGTHSVVDQCCPIDIGRGDGASQAIYFYGSSNIKSIRTTYVGSGVCPGVIPPWNSKIRVEVFGQLNAQSLIGIVVYAHISGPVTNGVYNTNNLRLGATASDTCNCGACYMGVHVHMERDFGGFSNSFSCGAPLYVNATWIYRWLII